MTKEMNRSQNKVKIFRQYEAMARFKVPKSFKEKQNELSIKMYKDQLELESQGYGKEQITQALMIKYQCCKNKVYRHTRRAPELLKAIEG